MSHPQSVIPASAGATTEGRNKGRGWWGALRHWAIARMAIYLVVVIAALVLSKLATMPFIPPAPSPLHSPLMLAANLGSALLLLCAYAVAVKVMERRGASEVSPRKGAGVFLVGAVTGGGLMTAVFAAVWALGLARFAPGAGTQGLAGVLAAAFAVAVLEELVLRAIVFRVVEAAAGTTIALVLSAILFGALHALNPGATLLSSAAIALEGGVLLALAFVVTRSLWFSIGIHMSWNFAQGGLFGAEVSGFAPTHSLLKATLRGPDILTGGAFGPEASVIAMIVCALASMGLGIIAARRAGWLPRRLTLWLA